MEFVKSTKTAIVGVDIGQRRDPTAVCVTEIMENIQTFEAIECKPPVRSNFYVVRFLERLPLGTPYPEVADRLAQIVDGVRHALPDGRVIVYVDQTGVGAPVVDLLRGRVDAYLTGVTIGAGDRFNYEGWEARAGKAYIVSRLQVLLQQGRIRLPKTPEGEQLARELLDFEIKVDRNGGDTYGAFRVGSHDDMVIALGLATLHDLAAVEYAPAIWR